MRTEHQSGKVEGSVGVSVGVGVGVGVSVGVSVSNSLDPYSQVFHTLALNQHCKLHYRLILNVQIFGYYLTIE